jgi:anaerobic selenocysteine-containing dehydrogenase
MKGLGSRNVYSASTLDQMPKQLQAGLMFGHWLSIPVPDMERTDFMLILGGNPMVSNGSLWTVPDFRGKAKALKARGGRLVVVDPRRSETAAIADQHLFIRPGADVFLLLGMVHTLFNEKLIRLGPLAPHTTGLEVLEAAVKGFTAEHMAPRCGIAVDEIRQLARTLASTERAVVYGRIGTCTQAYGTLTSWLIDVLNVLTGHMDVAGGAMFSRAPGFAANTAGLPGVGKGVVTGRRHARVSGAPEVMGELPIVCMAEEMETPGAGQIKALISIASNPVLSAPNGERIARALDGLEFMVSLDIYLNETTRHADVILPGLSPLEDLHYDMAFPQFAYRNAARYSDPVLPAPANHPPEWQSLLRLLAIVQGKGANVDVLALDDALFADEVQRTTGHQTAAALATALASSAKGPERLVDLALRTGPYGDQFGAQPSGISLAKVKAAAGGIDLGPLQPRIPELLRTPSGKIELAPPSLIADLSRPAAELLQPLSDAPHTMRIIGRRQVRSGNSWMHNLPILAKGPYRCTALVHPADAQRLGLVTGSQASVSNAHGALEVQVEVSDEVMPGVLSLPHGWGHNLPGTQLAVAAQRPGVNLNTVLSDRVWDPLSGNAVLSGVAVTLRALVPESVCPINS